MDIDTIRQLCSDGLIEWTEHSVIRIIQRGITKQDIEDVLKTGEIIENYPDDYPYPSCLILGGEKSLHVVCGIESKLWIITAYHPDLAKWEDDYKTRREAR